MYKGLLLPIEDQRGAQLMPQHIPVSGKNNSQGIQASIDTAFLIEGLETAHGVAGEPTGKEGGSLRSLRPPGWYGLVAKDKQRLIPFLFFFPESCFEFQQDLDDRAITDLTGCRDIFGDRRREPQMGNYTQ